jgi:hypothetical protein
LSEQEVGADQLSLLQNFYKADYADKAGDIEKASLLKSYAQSLLPALWLHVITAKLEALIVHGAPALPEAEAAELRIALRALRDAVAETAVLEENEQFTLQALTGAGRAMSLFRDGRVLEAAASAFRCRLPSEVLRSTLRLPSSASRHPRIWS